MPEDAMTEKSEYADGEFCWVDLSAIDMGEAKKWYGSLFGWEAIEEEPHEGVPPYAMFTKAGKVVAGLGQLPAEMQKAGVPPAWANYVKVSDATATQKRVEEAGGKVMTPATQVAEFGHLAFFTDPHGAVFAVWQPGTHRGAQLVNAPGAFTWNELATRDLDAAQSFYSQVFGWNLEPLEGMPNKMAVIKNEGRDNGTIILMDEKWGDLPPHWMVYLAVDDCDAMATKVGETGGKVLVQPTDIMPGRFAVCSDPQGATFTIMKLNNPPS